MFNFPIKSEEYERQRLAALHSYDVLGESFEHELDLLVKLAAQIVDVPMAYVGFVDTDKVFLKSAIGIEEKHLILPRDLTICQHTMLVDQIFVAPDVLLQPELVANLMAAVDSPLRFYASAAIKDEDGFPLGCLCLLDVVPREINQHQKEAIETLAKQVVTHLALKRKNAQLQAQTLRFNEFVDIFTASPEIHCILNRQGEILFINQAVTTLLDYTVDETIGQSMWNYCFRDDINKTVYTLEEGLKNKQKQFALDFRLISKHNEIRWISWGMVAKGDRWYCYGRDITENKRVENELTKLSFVASKIDNGVVINDANNRVTWINNAFEKITGFTLDDVKGQRLGDLISGPDTDWSIIERARAMTQQSKSFTVDMLAYRKDKTPIWISVYNTVVLDEDGKVESEVEIIIDITDKKKVEDDLQVLSLVASNTNTGVTIANAQGEVTWANSALEELLGYSLSELSGKMLGNLLSGPNTDRTSIAESRDKSLAKLPHSLEVLAYKKNGEEIWLSVYNTPILNDKGLIERQVELINDITQRKQVEREMVESREQALQLSEAKEMFLSVMSHEIRTPLNAVIGMTHLLLDNDPKESQIDDLNILKFSSENLLHIINDILDFTKIETGNLHLESIPFDLHTLCVDITNSLQVSAGKKGNQLILVYDDQIPATLLGDKTRLYQVLINLLGNAIKFTDNGTIQLQVKFKHSDENNTLIYFEVRDTGIGIPADKQSYIFETFTQAKTDIARKYGGTGLGLAITKKLLKLYDSEIEVKSTEGKGTTFCFEISFANNNTNDQVMAAPAVANLFTDKKVLVVDDNEVNILIAKRFLSKWGLVIDFAVNGEEAINKIMANTYDLIFMDIRMPGIDGFDTTKIIRELVGDYYKNVPIIALTASTLHNEHTKFKDSGMNGHVLKPFNPNEIKEVLNNYLR
ncbi:PAS domain-containing hybrid sensor histidine kinase/response regulator [Pedobacter insulae]|uniref:histidine kinase n=1 Tax=Pedobacter insulae TaxID=414048 RepID=A0A1I2THR2_9SPHI|nr:PAS domain-containing protein [Pedobacter insulae]SFG62887.1 PAS domain S-box-containing protein [Pedobacter insulae]